MRLGVRGEIIEETETEGSVRGTHRFRACSSARKMRKVKKDNSEEILTMKSLILAQDER